MGASTLFRIVGGLPQDLKGRETKKRRFSYAQESIICSAYISGKTAEELAKENGCSCWSVLNIISRHDGTKRRRGPIRVPEERKKILSERTKQHWKDDREGMLARIKGIGFRPNEKILEVRLTITARRKLTPLVIGRDKVCVRCGGEKRLHIHHILDLDDRPDLAMAPENCETLCGSCHAREESNRRWAMRRAQEGIVS